MQYDFTGLDPYMGDDAPVVIQNGIAFADFDSRTEGFYLNTRDAPSPGEKANTESVAYMHGVYDFSTLDDERFFENRDLTFEFTLPSKDYPDRSRAENELKRRLMPLPIQSITDTHLPPWRHWRGKVKSISVTDDTDKRALTATIVFDAYPFAIAETAEGDQTWNNIYFPEDVFQEVDFDVVDGTDQKIVLINPGDSRLSPTILVTGTVTITGDLFGAVTLPAGNYSDTEVALVEGINYLKLSGSGHVTFGFIKEVMY